MGEMDYRMAADHYRSMRKFRDILLADPYRPYYHFVVPEALGVPEVACGDPNGAFWANGRYHLMYIRGDENEGFSWGHMSSADLVHWRQHPDAITSEDSAGNGGCYSGGAFVDDDGTAYITYCVINGMQDAKGGGIGLAKSRPPHYDHWEKMGRVLVATRPGYYEAIDAEGNPVYINCSDASNIWKSNGKYYMQSGNLCVLSAFGRREDSKPEHRGDWVELFESEDLLHWRFVHRFYDRDPGRGWTDDSEDHMCPSFFPLSYDRDGGRPSGRHLQLFISHNRGCQYYIGTYRDDRFYPETHGRMTWGDRTFFAPEALLDPNGRQIMWALLVDDLDNQLKWGWSAVFSLPRVLWISEEDHTLRMAPAKELEGLRTNHRRWEGTELAAGGRLALVGINGECCEIRLAARFRAGGKIGLSVRRSPDGVERIDITCDREGKSLTVDTTQCGSIGFPLKETAPFEVGEDGRLELRVFIDRSVIEVFANERQAITRRAYPKHENSLGVEAFCADGGAEIDEIDVWELMPSNPY